MNPNLKLEIPPNISPYEKAPAIKRQTTVSKSESFEHPEAIDNCFENNGSLSPLSELDVKEVITFPMVPPSSTNKARSLGCHLKNEPDSPVSNNHVNLRRELKSDYGVFPENFEDDVNNWFLYISNEKRIDLITTLARYIAYSPESVQGIQVINDNQMNLNSSIKINSPHAFNNERENTPTIINIEDDIEDLSKTNHLF